jgi:anti-sigma factor RsiW
MSGCLKKEKLLAFVDGEMPSDEMELTERHIEVCTSCRREVEGVRATSVTVNALLNSLAPGETAGVDALTAVRIPYGSGKTRMRWTAVASVGVLVAALVLFVLIRRQHSAPAQNIVTAVTPAPTPSVEKKEVLAAAVAKPTHVGTPRGPLKVRQFQALDDGGPIETGMIYRVDLPASSVPNGVSLQSAKRIPAEVIVDEFGKVRAIRFLQ